MCVLSLTFELEVTHLFFSVLELAWGVAQGGGLGERVQKTFLLMLSYIIDHKLVIEMHYLKVEHRLKGKIASN